MIFAALFFIFGTILGSFANVAIYRMPLGKSVISPESHCPNCKTTLKFYHNAPIFSWLFLGGKCAFCSSKISVRYPLVEIFSGFLAVLAFSVESEGGRILDSESAFRSVILALSFINLLCLSLIDIAYKAVPDTLLKVGLILAALYSLSLERIWCAAIFMCIFWSLRFIISKVKKREAMGSADIFIAGIIGAILGVKLAFVAIYIAAVSSLSFYIGKKDFELPFVPFLSAGLVFAYAFESEILMFIGRIYE